MNKPNQNKDAFLAELNSLLARYEVSIELDIMTVNHRTFLEVELWDKKGVTLHNFNPQKFEDFSIGG